MQKEDLNIADMHCDTISKLFKRSCYRDGEIHGRREIQGTILRENDCHVDLLRMKESGYLLQNFALFVDMEAVLIEKGSQECKEKQSKEREALVWDEVMALLDFYEEEMSKNQDLIRPIKCYSDVEECRRAGLLASMLTVEEGGVCGGDIRKLHSLYDYGVRMLTLTWNYPNELGYPNLDNSHENNARKKLNSQKNVLDFLNMPDRERGLTKRGKEFVSEMEKLGMIIDVSHLSDAGFYDVLAHTRVPFVASHSNARSLCPCVRNLTDDMIRELARRGGVIGLNFCADFLVQKPMGTPNPGSVKDIALHAKHITNVGGMECLGLGSDFDGIDTHEELPGAEKMGRLWEALEEQGFKPSQIDKIFSQNVLRLYRELLS